ncbi:hypothetical protein [Glutamicibacter uratoxydans]|uniref:hypothetical protein n=1 Tax=Glutamicibacter uratoxydans TaxID=43667 RepID=UPI0031DB6C64
MKVPRWYILCKTRKILNYPAPALTLDETTQQTLLKWTRSTTANAALVRLACIILMTTSAPPPQRSSNDATDSIHERVGGAPTMVIFDNAIGVGRRVSK